MSSGVHRKVPRSGRGARDSVDRYLNDLDSTNRITPVQEIALAECLEAAARDCLRVAREAGITVAEDDPNTSEHDRILRPAKRLWRLLDELAEASVDAKRKAMVAMVQEELGLATSELLDAHEQMASARRRAFDARSEMVNANLALVVSVAKSYRNRGVAFADLIQEGNISLMGAVEKFDPRRGVRLSTYATAWLKQSLYRAIRSLSRTVRLPESATDAQSHSVPLDTPSSDGDRLSLTDVLSDDSVTPPDDAAAREQIRRHARHLLDTLTDQESLVIRHRFGIERSNTETLREIGEQLGLTRERIRQIEKAALEKLRRRLRHSALAG